MQLGQQQVAKIAPRRLYSQAAWCCSVRLAASGGSASLATASTDYLSVNKLGRSE